MDIRISLLLLIVLPVLSNYVDGLSINYRRYKCRELSIRKARTRLRSRGRIAVVICLPGYQLLGDKYVLCEEGQWAPQPLPQCTKTGCPSLVDSVPNGRVMESKAGVAYIYCNDGYTLSGSPTLACDGTSWNDTAPTCSQPGCPSLINSIPNGRVEKSHDGVSIYCNNGYKLNGSSELICDGTSWNDTIPTCLKDTNIGGLCDFEDDNNNMCGWYNDNNDNFNWQRHSMATPSSHVGTGPKFDHTLGEGLNGHYLYIEASQQDTSNVARLISPMISPINDEKPYCFTFWYHMYGSNIGRLNVQVGGNVVFTEFGNHGDRWIKGIIPLSLNISFQITIEAMRGDGYAADIAIDDLKFAEDLECLQQETKATELTLPGSCNGRCYDNSTTDTCQCQEECHANNTCCADFVQFCGLVTSTATKLPYASTTTSLPLLIRITTERTTVPFSSVFTSATNYLSQDLNKSMLSTVNDDVQTLPSKSVSLNNEVEEFTRRIDSATSNTKSVQFENLTQKYIQTTYEPLSTINTKSNYTNDTKSYEIVESFDNNEMKNDLLTNYTILPVLSTLKIQEFNVTKIPELVFLTSTARSVYFRMPQSNKSLTLNATKASNITLNKNLILNITKVPNTTFITKTTSNLFVNKSVWVNKNYTNVFRFANSTVKLKPLPDLNISDVKIKIHTFNVTYKPINVNVTTIKSMLLTRPTVATVNSSIWSGNSNKTFYKKDMNLNDTILKPIVLYYPNKTYRNDKIKTQLVYKVTRPSSYKTFPFRSVTKPLSTSTLPNLPLYADKLKSNAEIQKIKYIFDENFSHLKESNSNNVPSKWKFNFDKGDHAYYKYDKSLAEPQLIIGIVLGIITLGTFVSVTVCFLRKRKINRHRNADDNSDVQFLTSDELIDFHIARPSPEPRRSSSLCN